MTSIIEILNHSIIETKHYSNKCFFFKSSKLKLNNQLVIDRSLECAGFGTSSLMYRFLNSCMSGRR